MPNLAAKMPKWSHCLLDVKLRFKPQVRHQNENISSVTFSQQISGKNSDSKLKLPLKVSQKLGVRNRF